MHLHVIRALASFALLCVTTVAAPTSDDTTAAKSDLFSRSVACTPSAEEVTCWNDGYGLVPVGSFSFVMSGFGMNGGCQVQLLTQNFPYAGRICQLKDKTTADCGRTCPPPPPLPILLPHTSPVSLSINGEQY